MPSNQVGDLRLSRQQLQQHSCNWLIAEFCSQVNFAASGPSLLCCWHQECSSLGFKFCWPADLWSDKSQHSNTSSTLYSGLGSTDLLHTSIATIKTNLIACAFAFVSTQKHEFQSRFIFWEHFILNLIICYDNLASVKVCFFFFFCSWRFWFRLMINVLQGFLIVYGYLRILIIRLFHKIDLQLVASLNKEVKEGEKVPQTERFYCPVN